VLWILSCLLDTVFLFSFSFFLWILVRILPFYFCSIWDWLSGYKLSYCSNRGSKASRITSLQFVNSHDVSLLLVGSDDGTVRLWNNYTLIQQGREPGLVTAWHALADVSPVSRSLNGNLTVVMWILSSLKLNWFVCYMNVNELLTYEENNKLDKQNM
jgi:WD40 repeat protein